MKNAEDTAISGKACIPEAAWTQVHITAPDSLTLAETRDATPLEVTVVNDSAETLDPGSGEGIMLSFRLVGAEFATLRHECAQTRLSQRIPPGGQHTQEIAVAIPEQFADQVIAIRVGLVQKGKYWVERINDRMTFGLGVAAPFGLSVEWKDKDNFTGRFISTHSALTAIDVNPTFGWKASDNFGIGIGIIARFSDVELNNHRLTPNSPPIPGGLEFAKAKLEGGMDTGYGFNIGFLHKYNNSFHWGLQYRSRLTVDYEGELTLTQIPTGNPVLDGILGNVIPFNQKIGGNTSIEFPDIASLGLGFATSANSWLEFDINWNGWSTFDQIQVEVDSPALPDIELTQDWSDAWQYRVGFRFNSSARSQWRVGYIYDETPQPEYTVSPVLPDANRNDFTFGYGYMGDKFSVDLAVMYVKFDDRTVSESEVFYFGTYNQDAWLLGASFGF